MIKTWKKVFLKKQWISLLFFTGALLGAEGAFANSLVWNGMDLKQEKQPFRWEKDIQQLKKWKPGIQIKWIDLSDMDESKWPEWIQKESRAQKRHAIWTLIQGTGESSKCVVFVRGQQLKGSIESPLISRLMDGGLTWEQSWLLVERHELGHCVAAWLIKKGEPVGLNTEAFADVMASHWAQWEDKTLTAGVALAKARKYELNRSHETSLMVKDWLKRQPESLNPIEAAELYLKQ